MTSKEGACLGERDSMRSEMTSWRAALRCCRSGGSGRLGLRRCLSIAGRRRCRCRPGAAPASAGARRPMTTRQLQEAVAVVVCHRSPVGAAVCFMYTLLGRTIRLLAQCGCACELNCCVTEVTSSTVVS